MQGWTGGTKGRQTPYLAQLATRKRPVCLWACVPACLSNVSTPNFLAIPPFPSSLPHTRPRSFFSLGVLFRAEKDDPVFSRSLSYFLSSLFFLPCGFAFEVARPASSLGAASLDFIGTELAARNTAQRLTHISFYCAFLFPFAQGFIAVRCLSAFDSRYRSRFHLSRRFLSPNQLATHVDDRIREQTYHAYSNSQLAIARHTFPYCTHLTSTSSHSSQPYPPTSLRPQYDFDHHG